MYRYESEEDPESTQLAGKFISMSFSHSYPFERQALAKNVPPPMLPCILNEIRWNWISKCTNIAHLAEISNATVTRTRWEELLKSSSILWSWKRGLEDNNE